MNQMTNKIRITWIDSKEIFPEAIRDMSSDSEFDFSFSNSVECLTDSQLTADIFVIYVDTTVDQIDMLKSVTSHAGTTPIIIARVGRQSFELAIGAMDRGVTTIIAAEEKKQDVWKARLQALKPQYPYLKFSNQGSTEQSEESLQTDKDNKNKAFVFVDPLSRNLLALTERVAQSEVSVLLTGPTGAGKEVVARLLHESSSRYAGPFVAINCAAMPENLIEDMLFGHEKGSFTGASKAQEGLFEQGNGGTVFLDEIGDMSFNLQAKLLRVLQERNVVRLGGRKEIELDIRVVAATNHDLKKAIASREFREDLYFRLSAFKLAIPPLRERPLDILPLVSQFIQLKNQEAISKEITSSAQRKLLAHHWPGNVRELENVIARALVLAGQRDVDEDHLIFDDLDEVSSVEVGSSLMRFSQLTPPEVPSNFGGDYKLLKEQITNSPREAAQVHDLSNAVRNSECQAIIAAINGTKNRKEAAERLGISPRTLRHKIQKLREEGINLTHAYAM